MRIAVLAYDQISPFMLSTPLAVFGESFVAGGHRIDVCADPGPLNTTGGLTVTTAHGLKTAREADILILPGWRHVDDPLPENMVAELAQAGARGAIVVGLCLGAFGLAEAGLLNGRRATTHWAQVDRFALRYPGIDVDRHALFVDEDRVLTSAGVASGLDCCLHLLTRLSGLREANRVARHLVLAPQRSGQQSQLLERPAIGSSADRRITELLEALQADPLRTPTLDELARQAGMSRRSLSRHIRARIGGSLGQWLRQFRLARAQDMLVSGAHGIDSIAHRSGFADAQALRSAFRAQLGLTPTRWLSEQKRG